MQLLTLGGSGSIFIWTKVAFGMRACASLLKSRGCQGTPGIPLAEPNHQSHPTQILSDKWTAFAPDFRELEENEEYIEREDEFDVVQRAATPGKTGMEM